MMGSTRLILIRPVCVRRAPNRRAGPDAGEFIGNSDDTWEAALHPLSSLPQISAGGDRFSGSFRWLLPSLLAGVQGVPLLGLVQGQSPRGG